MLRYRATEIRLTSQDVDDTSKRLAARRAAANARSTICQLPAPSGTGTGTGPRLRRGPERSRDESVVHANASSAVQSDALAASPAGPGKQLCSAREQLAFQTTSNPGCTDTQADVSYTPEPGLAENPLLSGRVHERPLQRTSLSPKKDDHSTISAGLHLLQLDGPSDRTICAPASPEKACDGKPTPSMEDLVPGQRAHVLGAPAAASKTAQSSLVSHQPCSSDARPRLEARDGPGRSEHPARESTVRTYVATSTGTRLGGSAWRDAGEAKGYDINSATEEAFDLASMQEALDEGASTAHDAIPYIRLPSPASTHSSSNPDKRRLSLPTLTALSPARRKSRSSSVSQASEHSSRSVSQAFAHLRSTSTPDLLRPLLGPPSASDVSSRRASGIISTENSSTSSAAVLELIRQDSSPLERLEQETRSRMAHAPSGRLGSAMAASSRSQSPGSEELRMPTFESPERPSPQQQRARRYRDGPTFAEIPNAPISTSFDLLPSFDYSPPSLQPGTFVDRYPGTVATGRRRGAIPDQGATSMPSLAISRPSRRGTSGQDHDPAQVARNTQPGPDWGSRSRGGGEDLAGSRRNPAGGQQRLRRYRSISARFLPSWQAEQENSGRAERMQVMAEIQERRRYVEQTNDGRLDRTPPGLGRFERELFRH